RLVAAVQLGQFVVKGGQFTIPDLEDSHVEQSLASRVFGVLLIGIGENKAELLLIAGGKPDEVLHKWGSRKERFLIEKNLQSLFLGDRLAFGGRFFALGRWFGFGEFAAAADRNDIRGRGRALSRFDGLMAQLNIFERFIDRFLG